MKPKRLRDKWSAAKALQRAARQTTHKPITVELGRQTVEKLEAIAAGRSKAATLTDLINRA